MVMNLQEGTWAFPRTVKAAKELSDLMSKPLPAGVAKDKLYHIFGDDRLFDVLDNYDETESKVDVRDSVKRRLKQFLDAPEVTNDLDKDVVSRLKKILESSEKLSFKEFLSEAGRVHVLKKSGIKPRGAPEDKARVFDQPGTDRSVLAKLGKGKYNAIEFSDEGDFIMVLVMRDDIEPTQYGSKRPKKDPHENYYGVNVLFFPDGKIDADLHDPRAKQQWKQDRDKIIATAKASLKDEDLPGIYHGLGGKSHLRGKGKLSFDIKD